MNRMSSNILQIEAPSAEGVLDFLSMGLAVVVSVSGAGEVTISARASHGEGSCTWDDHELVFQMPEIETPDAECVLCSVRYWSGDRDSEYAYCSDECQTEDMS